MNCILELISQMVVWIGSGLVKGLRTQKSSAAFSELESPAFEKEWALKLALGWHRQALSQDRPPFFEDFSHGGKSPVILITLPISGSNHYSFRDASVLPPDDTQCAYLRGMAPYWPTRFAGVSKLAMKQGAIGQPRPPLFRERTV
jgi:hypothetical protein